MYAKINPVSSNDKLHGVVIGENIFIIWSRSNVVAQPSQISEKGFSRGKKLIDNSREDPHPNPRQEKNNKQ